MEELSRFLCFTSEDEIPSREQLDTEHPDREIRRSVTIHIAKHQAILSAADGPEDQLTKPQFPYSQESTQATVRGPSWGNKKYISTRQHNDKLSSLFLPIHRPLLL